MARHDAKATSTTKAPKRATRSNKQLQQTLLTPHSPLTQHPSLSSLAKKRSTTKTRHATNESDDSSTDSPVQLQYSDSDQQKMDLSDDDHLSDATDPMNNTMEQLSVTRVDLKIKTPPSETPEETTSFILQQLLSKLKTYDKKVSFAPWKENDKTPSIFSPPDMPTRPSELEAFLPRVRFMRSGLTWYSGLRIVHSIPMPELRKDMLPWLKEEGHGLFTRTLQAENLVDVGWFVYSTWEMEADALAASISNHIQIEVGLRWKMISLGTRERIPTEQQVRALHIEVAVENRQLAQKALLAVYGRKNTGNYPNGVRLRFALPIGAAYNLNTKAKLEKLRTRQQLWSQTYKKGQSWEITQIDFQLTNTLTLRQALNQIISTTDKRFPLFHSVDRSIGKNTGGISFQFLPELESEARLMISNLLPYLHHHYGDIAKKCFTPSAVDRLQDCQWDPIAGTIVGAYDEEINYLEEDDIMTQYISSKSSTAPNLKTTGSNPNPPQPLAQQPLNTTAYGQDDDSVSTLGNNTTQKWRGPYTPSPIKSPFAVPRSITHSPKPSSISDDKSIGSVSTLNTRINSIEGQFQELTGTMEHIKEMLNLLANPKPTKDGDPRTLESAGRGNSTGDSL